MNSRVITAALALCLTLAVLCSCGEDDELTPPTPADTEPVFTSLDQLVWAFLVAYEDRDSDLLQSMLHPDYVTILQAATQAEFPSLGATLDLAEETRIAQRMFSGQPITDPDGNTVPAISDIGFEVLEQRGPWADSGPNGVVPDAQVATYEMIVIFDRVNGDDATIQGTIKFYAVGRDTVIDGADRTAWKMAGQEDLTDSGSKGVERVEWGKIKAFYR